MDLERDWADIYAIRQISFVTDDVCKFNIEMSKNAVSQHRLDVNWNKTKMLLFFLRSTDRTFMLIKWNNGIAIRKSGFTYASSTLTRHV